MPISIRTAEKQWRIQRIAALTSLEHSSIPTI